jgi:hypothetical protein
MWVLINTESMQSALFFSMKPMPPMFAARLKTWRGAFGGSLAVLFHVEIERQILDIVEALIPLVERLDVHRADPPEALPPQVRDEVAANESTGAGHYNQTILHWDYHITWTKIRKE